MRFIKIRDLRGKSSQIQRELPKEKEMILTSNGNPIAILAAVSGDTLEELLIAFRQARAMSAVAHMQKRSMELGTNQFPLEEINREIAAERKSRKKI